MSTLVLYDSKFGNTEHLARIIAEHLNTQAHHISTLSTDRLAGVELLVVGCPTQGMGPTEATRDAVKALPDGSLKGIKVAAFDTRFDFDTIEKPLPRLATSFLKLRFAAKPLEALLEAKGGQPVAPAEGFFVTGNEGPLREGEAERAAEWASRLP
jgi:flavodoxin